LFFSFWHNFVYLVLCEKLMFDINSSELTIPPGFFVREANENSYPPLKINLVIPFYLKKAE